MDVVTDGNPYIARPSFSSATAVVARIRTWLRPCLATRLRAIAARLPISQILSSPGFWPAYVLAQASARTVDIVLEFSKRAIAGAPRGLLLPAGERLLASGVV